MATCVTGRTTPAVKRPADRQQRAYQRVPLVRDEPVADLAPAPVGDHDADDHRHRHAEAEDRLSDEVRDLVERAPEQVAEHAEERGPEAGADDAVRDEAPVGEPRRAGDERRERPHQPDEAADQDRLAAVAVEVALDLLEPLLGDLEARAVLARGSGVRAACRCRSSWCRRARRRAQTMPISGSSWISPWPAITPPAMTIVSPGATRPTNAPVSRKAATADDRVRPRPERLGDVLDDLSSGRAASTARRSRRRPARARGPLPSALRSRLSLRQRQTTYAATSTAATAAIISRADMRPEGTSAKLG